MVRGNSVSSDLFMQGNTMNNLGNYKYFMGIFCFLVISSSFACGVQTPSFVNLAIHTAEEKMFSYGVKSIDENIPFAVVTNCRETALKRRFLMITFGPDVVEMSDGMRSNNFDRMFNPTQCSIRNNPLEKKYNEDERRAAFDKKWKYINECIEITVKDMAPRPFTYPADQAGCKIKTLTSHSISFSGGFCFIQPKPDSEINVSVSVKNSCKTRNGLMNLNVNLQDLESEVSFFTASNYKEDIELNGVGTFPVRISTNPLDELFRSSDDFGILRPTFPGDFPVNEMHLGKIVIKDEDDELSIKTPLIVNNVCKSVSKNGLTSSICDYSNPYVAEIKLLNSKGIEEATWYDGGIAPTQWQGILRGEGQQLSKESLKINEKYRLELSLSDPYFEFNTFKKRIKSRIDKLNSQLPDFFGAGEINVISEVRELGSLQDMVLVEPISDINFYTGISDLTQARRRLGTFFSSNLYPPMYIKACSPDSGKCENIGKPFVKFIATFKVGEKYSILDLEIERISKILGSYKRKISAQPEFVCN